MSRESFIADSRGESREAAIRKMTPGDWPEVRRIFAEGIETGEATFETEVPEWERWDAAHRADCRLVAELESGVGWAALAPVSARAVYAGVAEVSVYVAAGTRGRGIGRSLLTELAARARDAGIWTLQAGIFPENAASVSVHRACGFRVVGRREKLGRLRGIWRDVLLLERRLEPPLS